jgi:hypothetical protein
MKFEKLEISDEIRDKIKFDLIYIYFLRFTLEEPFRV